MATVKFKDSTLTLLGSEVKAGQTAPDFKVQKSADMSDYTLASGAGKTRISPRFLRWIRRYAIWKQSDLMKRRANFPAWKLFA
jgi:hypothetical protein